MSVSESDHSRNAVAPSERLSPTGIDALACGMILLSVLLSTGCGNEGSSGSPTAPECCHTVPQGTQAAPGKTSDAVRSFTARGVIRSLPEGGKSVLLQHDEIPGFMPEMTMEFSVRDSRELRNLQTGDAITFRLQVTEESSWIEGLERSTAPALDVPPPRDPPVTSLLHAGRVKLGDVLPDAGILAEDGRTIQLSEFEGRALAITFIFTRCPLPDYCPRMSRHFSRVRELLLQQPGAPANWQLLSISFDPEFDQPDVLKRYADSHRGPVADRWLFAAAPADVMTVLGSQLDFRFADEGGSFIHNLRTVVLDPRRRIHRQFDGNEWQPEELAQALLEAARSVP